MRLGFLPPISNDALTNRCAVCAASSRPTRVEPVKLSARTSGCATSAAPARGPRPCTMFSVPGGNPASAHSSPRRCAVIGVISLGFATTQFPAASAGAIFQVSR